MKGSKTLRVHHPNADIRNMADRESFDLLGNRGRNIRGTDDSNWYNRLRKMTRR